ncbi:MAG: hypothetical protein A2Y48_02735 [Nitrospirae bacterium RIFCSPLOW2_12_42_9]|nr:MAG: hypothetical protein A2Y48_02735 [Nitrospirae bacterium RIFCSPLOW2_12_42_9]
MARKHGRDKGILERVKGSGVWYVRCYVSGREKWIKAGSKTAARSLYARMKTAELEGRILPKRHRVLFPELAEERKRYADCHHKRKGDDNPRVQRWVDAFSNIDASIITPSMIERVMFEMKNDGFANATINRYLVVLKAIFNKAVYDGLLAVNPASKVKLWKVNNEVVRYLTPKQETDLLEHLPERFHPIVLTALNTGLRQGELLRLTWQDIDWNMGILTVRESKSGEARRVPMNSTVQEILTTLRPQDYSQEDTIFPHDARYLRRAFDKAVSKAKLNPFRFHDLRHTFASRLAMQGANDRTIMTLGGWKSPRMLNRYAHISPTHLWQAVEGLTELKPSKRKTQNGTVAGTVAEGITVREGSS